MTDTELQTKVLNALRITNATAATKSEVQDLIDAAFQDMSFSDINTPSGAAYTAATATPGVVQAVLTYCRAMFGDLMEASDQQTLLTRYDYQKAMLKMEKYSEEES